jgi:hypothetical protein
MTTINDISDIVRILNENAEWKQAVRGAILGEEISQLPQRLADFIESANRNFELVYGRLGALETSVNHLTGRFDNGLGTNYEYRAEHNVFNLADRYLNLGRVTVMRGSRIGSSLQFINVLEDARDEGIIDREQFREITLLDLVFSGKRRDDNAELLVAAEVSITIGDSDIIRAAERARMLERAANRPAVPAVVCANADDARRTLAEQLGVTVMLLSEN